MSETTELLFHHWRDGRCTEISADVVETRTARTAPGVAVCLSDIERDVRKRRSAVEPWRGGWISFLSYDYGTAAIGARVSEKTRVLPMARFHRIVPRAARRRPARDTAQPTCQLSARTDTRSSYVRKIGQAIEELRRGNAFEINLSQRWTWRFRRAPRARELFETISAALRPRYGFYESAGDDAIMGFSPELFFEIDGRRITAEPIKGTAAPLPDRPPSMADAGRGRRPSMAPPGAPLLSSAKDRAELLMITDLFRNDFGKICDPGTIRATGPREMALPYARHLFTRIGGRLRRDATLVEILPALFPSGSVTGAPKIAACEIIDRIEPFAREEAFGAVGWIGCGRAVFSVSIRTALLHGRDLRYTAGGGITVYSEPPQEYEESLLKARRFMKCLPVRNR